MVHLYSIFLTEIGLHTAQEGVFWYAIYPLGIQKAYDQPLFQEYDQIAWASDLVFNEFTFWLWNPGSNFTKAGFWEAIPACVNFGKYLKTIPFRVWNGWTKPSSRPQ